MTENDAYDKSLKEAMASGEMGEQSLQSRRLNNVLLPNRFNGRSDWFESGEPGQLPTVKKKHRLLGGIMAIVQMYGVDLANGWRAI